MSERLVEQTGARIRDRRIDRGLRQADLAKAVGISPSYLNLIEHNKRRIAGALLIEVAQALDIAPTQLTEGAARAVLDQMLAAAASLDIVTETDKIEDMAARYPGWANLIAAQSRDRAALWARIEDLTDRMAHDPHLSTSLHGVISAVTSIRSTASILTSDENLDADWRARFHRNIHDDARRLAQSSQALMQFLDAPDAKNDSAPNAFAAFEAVLAENDFDINALQEVLKSGRHARPINEMLGEFVANAKAREVQMPMDQFAIAAKNAGYDPEKLAQECDASLVDVMRQLAMLPFTQDNPPIGLVTCDASGAITYLRSVPNFTMPRNGAVCPMWPIFTALGQPGRPVKRDVIMPDNAARPMRCIAIAEQELTGRFDMPPVMRATMLVLTEPADTTDDPLPLGPSCRICPRADCPARREASALSSNLL